MFENNENETWKSFPTKFALGLPSNSQDASLSRFARGGSAATSEKQRNLLMNHAQRLLQKIGPGRTLRRADAIRFLGPDFKRDAKLAKVNQKKLLTNFIGLFPEKLQIDRNNVKSLEQDPRIGSAGQPLQRLRRIIAPVTPLGHSRGPLDPFLI